MSVEGGQVLRGARAASSKIIWLPGASAETKALLPRQAPGGARATPARAAVHAGRGLAGMLAALAAQTVALTLFANSGGYTELWAAAAVFGLGVTVASGFTTLMSALFDRPLRAAAGGSLSYNALTMALIMAASPMTTAAGALLLLPATTILSVVVRRMSMRRVADERDILLLLAVLISVAGICENGGWHAWTAAVAALVAGILLQTGPKSRSVTAGGRQWHVWMKTSFLCVAIASTMLGKTGAAMLFAAPQPAFLALAAGVLYGGGVGIAGNIRNRRLAPVPVAAAPFLAAALLSVATGTFLLPKVAAAILLAAALTLSRRKTVPGSAPLTRPLGCPGGES